MFKQNIKAFLEKINPNAVIRVKYVVDKTRAFALRLIAHSGFLCGFYYVVLDSSFRREQQAVVLGMLRHLNSDGEKAVSALMRRNIHRIEKGLIMIPRKPIFGLDYISETIQSLEDYVDCKSGIIESHSDPILDWAIDVLDTYFDLQENHPIVTNAQSHFNKIKTLYKLSSKTGDSSPKSFAQRCADSTRIAISDFEAFVHSRRSVRWYKKEKVDRCKVDRALELAAQSPSACNRQPFHYKIFDCGELLDAVRSMPGGTGGWANNIPMVIAVVGDLSSYFNERDRHCIYIDASLSVMTFLYALQCQGISSCTINWPDVSNLERRAAKVLKLEKFERIIMLIAVGIADQEGLIPFSAKTSLNDFRMYGASSVESISNLDNRSS